MSSRLSLGYISSSQITRELYRETCLKKVPLPTTSPPLSLLVLDRFEIFERSFPAMCFTCMPYIYFVKSQDI